MISLLRSFWDSVDLFLKENRAEEVAIDGQGQWLLRSSGRIHCVGAPSWFDPESVVDFVIGLADLNGQRLDYRCPSAGGYHEARSLRWHALLAPLVDVDALLVVRKHRFKEVQLESFGVCQNQLSVLRDIIVEGVPILICGRTGVGKTTFLSALLQRFCSEQRVVLIEPIREIPRLSPYWLNVGPKRASRSEERGYDLRAVCEDVLRLSPDRIVFSEMKFDELNLFYEMSLTGHGGCIATFHGESVVSVKERLVNQLNAKPRSLNQSCIPLFIVQLSRRSCDENFVSYVSEMTRIEIS